VYAIVLGVVMAIPAPHKRAELGHGHAVVQWSRRSLADLGDHGVRARRHVLSEVEHVLLAHGPPQRVADRACERLNNTYRGDGRSVGQCSRNVQPAVDAAGNVYVARGLGALAAFAPDGTMLWPYTASSCPTCWFGSAAIGADDTIYAPPTPSYAFAQ